MNPRQSPHQIHLRPLQTGDVRPAKSVASENAAMSAKCSGNSARSLSASSRVRNRTRRVGSFSIRTLGARSSHSHSWTHFLRIARTTSKVRFTVALLTPSACTTTKQHAASDFCPPEGNYNLVVMRPDIDVSLLTAGGQLEPREDWTYQARENVLTALKSQQIKRGGNITIATSARDAGGDSVVASKLDRLHEAVGRSIQIHKYTPGF